MIRDGSPAASEAGLNVALHCRHGEKSNSSVIFEIALAASHLETANGLHGRISVSIIAASNIAAPRMLRIRTHGASLRRRREARGLQH